MTLPSGVSQVGLWNISSVKRVLLSYSVNCGLFTPQNFLPAAAPGTLTTGYCPDIAQGQPCALGFPFKESRVKKSDKNGVLQHDPFLRIKKSKLSLTDQTTETLSRSLAS